MDKKAAIEKINDLKTQIARLLSEAEAIATDADVSFEFNPTGAYGAGAYFTGRADEWDASENDVVEGDGFWRSSSQSC